MPNQIIVKSPGPQQSDRDEILFPYGIADFYVLMTEGYYYIDRTTYIPLLEKKGKTLLFLRPRRFGKSLLLSMLENYYDVKKADEFDRLFGQLAIGQTPTPHHNRFLILRWNFSMISADSSLDNLKQTIHHHINGCIEDFTSYYRDILDYDIVMDEEDAMRSVQSLFAAVRASPYPLYLLIDEYDSLANDILMAQQTGNYERYEALASGDGILKTVYRWVKAGMEGRGLERVFITGVSPILAKDLTSSFNMSENISLDDDVATLCGFSEAEITTVLTHIQTTCGLTDDQVQEALTTMRTFYNGYRFTYEQKDMIYNPTLAIYFLKHFQHKCTYPRRILDTNLTPDRDKIRFIADIPSGDYVIATAANDLEPLIIPELSDHFGLHDMLYREKDNEYLISLLFYLGILTLLPNTTPEGFLQMRVPNLVTRKLYVEQLADMLMPREAVHEAPEVASHFYRTGNMADVCAFIERTYLRVFDNRDYRWTNELTFKTMFVMVLFSDTFYIMDSEPAIGRMYGDLIMIVRPDMRRYTLQDFLMEFKYVSLTEIGLSGEEVRAMEPAALMALEPVQRRVIAAQEQLGRYRQILTTTYGERLRLQTYCIVAIGYERLLHVE